MQTVRKTIFLFIISLAPFHLLAQQGVEMADTFRAEGKIYVVIAVLVIILAILLFYVFRIDRKINRLEQNINNKQ